MVEGPGCKVKGEKLRKKIINWTVSRVAGSAIKEVWSVIREWAIIEENICNKLGNDFLHNNESNLAGLNA